MEAYVIGTACTPFGKFPDLSFKALARQAFGAVLADAALDDGHAIDAIYFANVKMDMFGQPNIRGQVAFSEITRDGLLRDRVPFVNVEGACASASLALHGAYKDVLSGEADLALAIGVEKTFIPNDPERQYRLFTGGEDRLEPALWERYFEQVGDRIGRPWSLNAAGGTLNMDTYAMQASYHMAKYGTTARQLAEAASKDHHHGSLNPLAQYRFETSPEQVLADRPISAPLTRAMCSPIGDGAAAALVCSKRYLDGLPAAVRARALRIRACALGGGKYRELDEPSVSHVTAKRAYARAGLQPSAVQVAEIHDATSFGEIYQPEMLGFCEFGEGGPFVASGATRLGGRLPINLSGGLVSKGHPVGATGLSMIYELGLQLRGEAGPRQTPGARIGLAQNGGGTIGFDDAVCAVTILEAV